MTDAIGNTGSSDSLISSLNSELNTTGATKQKSIGKDEFLTMLVTQLKNQDPLDPMKNEDFAVNLAQFSSLEQLTGINEKIGAANGGGSSALASYASFLGREVSVKSDDLTVTDKDAGMVSFTNPVASKDVNIDITALDGTVLGTYKAGALGSGQHSVPLKDLDLPDGSYKVVINATSYSGDVTHPETDVSGIVSGLIPGETPTLLVNGKEVKVSDVSMVQVASTKATTTPVTSAAA